MAWMLSWQPVNTWSVEHYTDDREGVKGFCLEAILEIGSFGHTHCTGTPPLAHAHKLLRGKGCVGASKGVAGMGSSAVLGDGSFGAFTFFAREHKAEECNSHGLPLTPNTILMTGNFEEMRELEHKNLCAYLDLVKCAGGQ